jgi:hypothetical protein
MGGVGDWKWLLPSRWLGGNLGVKGNLRGFFIIPDLLRFRIQTRIQIPMRIRT